MKLPENLMCGLQGAVLSVEVQREGLVLIPAGGGGPM